MPHATWIASTTGHGLPDPAPSDGLPLDRQHDEPEHQAGNHPEQQAGHPVRHPRLGRQRAMRDAVEASPEAEKSTVCGTPQGRSTGPIG